VKPFQLVTPILRVAYSDTIEQACFEALLTAVPAFARDLASATNDDIKRWADLVSFLKFLLFSH
jgi:hypothetical protein